MLTRIRNYIFVVIAIGIFYFFLSHHVMFFSFTQFDLLKKTEPTFKYTFISVRQVNPYKMLRDENLRDAGIGEYFVENGKISEQKLQDYLFRIEAEMDEDEEE